MDFGLIQLNQAVEIKVDLITLGMLANELFEVLVGHFVRHNDVKIQNS